MPSSRRRASAWLVLTICISETAPSCMRAPPLAEITSSGVRSASASSAASVIASPSAEPRLAAGRDRPPPGEAGAAADEAEVHAGEDQRVLGDRRAAVDRAGPGAAALG